MLFRITINGHEERQDMKVSIVGIVGVPAQYGGFETLVDNLLSYSSSSIEYTVFCSRKAYLNGGRYYKKAKLKYLPINANGIASIIYDLWGMLLSLRSDVILVLGVSAGLFFPFIRVLYRGKIITNIDGLEWTRLKWSLPIRIFLKISEWFAVKFSNETIADNEAILENVKKTYHKKVNLIEYGGDNVQDHSVYIPCKNVSGGRPYAFCVCRIEPENNIELILKAFENVHPLDLVFVGNWSASLYGEKLKKRYCMFEWIKLLDPIYDLSVLNTLRMKASIYIHGHSAGGTNPSLVEAMSLQLPVIAYDVIYNRKTTEEGCLYFSSSEELAKLITNTTEGQKKDISQNMFEIAHRRYRWAIIVPKYEKLYS
jgi:glycosyltransferase involved in cell wall biosynthesis